MTSACLANLILRVGCVFCWRWPSLRVCVRGSGESHGVRCLHSETDFEGRLCPLTPEAWDLRPFVQVSGRAGPRSTPVPVSYAKNSVRVRCSGCSSGNVLEGTVTCPVLFSLVLHPIVADPSARSLCAPWVSWSLDERQLPMISLFSLLWSSCLRSWMTLSKNLPDNSELKCEQRSWILPEQASFRNIEIMWIVFFCSGKWIVPAVVTRFFASVHMWISATSLDVSIHNPRRNCHEPGHCMNEYNSATVVESTVLLIFWLSSSTRLPYDIPSSEDCSRNFAKTLPCLSVKTHLHCFCRRHREIQLFSNGLVGGQNWSFTGCDLSCLASFLRALTSPAVGEAALEARLEKLVSTLELCPAL